MCLLKSFPLHSVRMQDRLWSSYVQLVDQEVLPYMWELINDRVEGAQKSWCMQNFRIAAGLEKGSHQGAVFQDTDVYKWLEAVAYSLAKTENKKLEDTADGAIDLISAAQCEDGYLNTYFTITGEERWSDLQEGHELYSAGHLFEAAAAYYSATGKRKLLDTACRFADQLCEVFGSSEGQCGGYPGHPEVEVGLIKLYRLTGEKKYLELADHFIRVRGRRPCYFLNEKCRRDGTYIFPEFEQFDMDYFQADRPLGEQTGAQGHAVRAGYLYSAMADLAAEENDEKLLSHCRTLWNDIISRKMYLTGSIGSASFGERFTGAYDLPNATNYSESCASVSLAMFSNRMFRITRDSRYADVMELALYNTVLAGISMDGKSYFYVNPLQVNPETAEHNPTMDHVKTERQKWFGVACCPPNIARTLESMPDYAFARDDDSLYVNLFIAGEILDQVFGTIGLEADYPRSGKVKVTVKNAPGRSYKIAVRIPGYCKNPRILLNGTQTEFEAGNGYAVFEKRWEDGDSIELVLDLPLRYVYCNPLADEDIGRCALMKGPWVYCLEEADNGKGLASVFADTGHPASETEKKIGRLNLPAAVITGMRADIKNAQKLSLYSTTRPVYKPAQLTAVPYFSWNNRGKGEMVVWMKDLHPVG